MSADKGVLQPKQPVRFSARNFRTPVRSNSKGNIHLVSFEVSDEDHDKLKTIPKLAIIAEVVLWYDYDDTTHQGEAKNEKAPTAAPDAQAGAKEKKAKQKGEHGAFWNLLFKPDHNGASFFGEPNIRAWIDRSKVDEFEPETDREFLHRMFDVDSLTFVSPDDFVARLKEVGDKFGLPMGQAIRMVTAAEEKTTKGKE